MIALTGQYRIAADRLYRSPHIQRLAADQSDAFGVWISNRMECAEPEVNRAHDIRHLCKCIFCGLLGDERRMPLVDDKHMHGLCAIAKRGLEAVAKLPIEEVNKISLGEIGPTAMKHLCSAVSSTHLGAPL